MKNNKFIGFSLSELLIAMSIIGIIATLTVPNLMASYQKKSMVSLLQKIYVELGQNLTILQTENYNKTFYQSILSLQGRTIANTAGKFFVGDANYKPYYEILKDCGTTAQPCFAQSYSNIAGDSTSDFSCNDGYNVILKNGSAMCLIPADDGDPAKIHVDVNGEEGPNIGGRDMFTFYIYDDFSIDEKDITPAKIKDGTAETARNDLFNKSCLSSTVGEGCFGKLLNNNWQMDY